jgi:hypothetical protein
MKACVFQEYELVRMIEDHIKLFKKEREQRVESKETVLLWQANCLFLFSVTLNIN